MRRPKFKIWDKINNRWYEPIFKAYEGEVFELLLTTSGELVRRTMRHTLDHESLFPDQYEVVQWTGLHDRNGKEVYEDDVLSRQSPITGETYYYRVYWDNKNACYVADGRTIKESLQNSLERGYAVCGNVYEHPHLLEG